MDRMDPQLPPPEGVFRPAIPPPAPPPPPDLQTIPPPAPAVDQDGLPLDPKERRKIVRGAYFGVRPGTVRTAIPEAFVDDVTPMRITYMAMTATQKQEFYDLFGSGTKIPAEKRKEAHRYLADRYLLKWEGYTTREGDLLPFKEAKDEAGDRKVEDNAWESLALPLRSDIFMIILTDSGPTELEAAGVKS
jgi:hypothetical protein